MRIFILFLALWLVSNTVSNCQISLRSKEVPQKDVTDFFNKKNKYKAAKPAEFAFVPAVGYSLQTGFAGVLSANVAFQPNMDDETKQSTIAASVTYSQYNQTILPINANIWSKNGKWNYNVDWRFMEYPSETWGLSGRNDPNNNGYTVNFSYLRLHQTVLRTFEPNWYIGSGIFYDYFWNIKESDENGKKLSKAAITNLRQQGLSGDKEIAFSVPIRLLYDSRLNQVNPMGGFYFSILLRKSFTAFGASKDWQSLVVDARKYFKVTDSGNVLALWFYSWRTETYTPYFLLPSIGWDDNFNTGRGYIQGRYRSNILSYLEAEYRFRISQNGLIGGVVFSNISAYITNLTKGVDAYAPAAGLGLRIKLNKHSGTNLCIDYGIGESGSRGFFVNVGEVF